MDGQALAYREMQRRVSLLKGRMEYEDRITADLERQLSESRANKQAHAELRAGFIQILTDAGQPIECAEEEDLRRLLRSHSQSSAPAADA